MVARVGPNGAHGRKLHGSGRRDLNPRPPAPQRRLRYHCATPSRSRHRTGLDHRGRMAPPIVQTGRTGRNEPPVHSPIVRTTVEPLEGNKVKLSVEIDEGELDRAIDAAF